MYLPRVSVAGETAANTQLSVPSPTAYCHVSLWVFIDVSVDSRGGSVAKWLVCWTQAQNGLGSNCSRDAVG